MIALTYAISGLLIAGSGYLFLIGAVSALTQCLAWMVTFFFASAAAIAAYLTAGVPARDPSSRESLSSLPSVPASAVSSVHGGKAFIWALLYSPQMTAAALIELIWGVAAERRPLEDVARPLTFIK